MNWLWILFAIGGGILFWAFCVEPNWHRLRRITVRGQKKIKTPFTILHLSDIHFVGKVGLKQYFFQRLSMLNPDLIVVTGDVIDNDEGIDTAAKYLSGLRARYGTYLVLGNHEYYDYQFKDNIRYHLFAGKVSPHRNDTERFVRAMQSVGIRVLVNDSARLEIHGNPVVIGGTDDPLTQKINMGDALRGMDSATYNIMLMHVADGLLQLQRDGLVDLVLSGHTHGGQIRIPFWGPVHWDTKLPRRYVDGMNEYKGIKVFVSRGVGAGRYLFLRFACRPEAVLFEVRP